VATTTRKQETKTATKAKRGLGAFVPTGDATEEHRCSGACRKMLPVRSFPTTRAGTRVSECRACRDKRTKAAKR